MMWSLGVVFDVSLTKVFEKVLELLAIWDATVLMRRRCNLSIYGVISLLKSDLAPIGTTEKKNVGVMLSVLWNRN